MYTSILQNRYLSSRYKLQFAGELKSNYKTTIVPGEGGQWDSKQPGESSSGAHPVLMVFHIRPNLKLYHHKYWVISSSLVTALRSAFLFLVSYTGESRRSLLALYPPSPGNIRENSMT